MKRRISLPLIFAFAALIKIEASAQTTTTVTFNTSGSSTFTTPAGVTQITVQAWGAGGAGGARTAGNNVALAGGGGGAFSSSVLTVTPSTGYTVSVGLAGTGTTAGGDTFFNTTGTLLAKGGSSVANNGNTGAGGLASGGVGTTKLNGGNGGTGTGGSFGGGGGSSAGTAAIGNYTNTTTNSSTGATAPSGGGNGGTGSTGGGSGVNGSGPGGGGGGGYRAGGGTTQNPGDGADGQVIITYVTPPTVTNLSPSPVCGVTTGVSVTITGTNFTGASTVTFNGTSVGFVVNNSTTITATLPVGITTGNVVVTNGSNFSTSVATFTVAAAAPATPGAITGTSAQCASKTGLTYSISAVANATTYTWAVPTGWSITAGQGTISITVSSGTNGQNGNITVTAGNVCGTSAASTIAVTSATCPPVTYYSRGGNWNVNGSWSTVGHGSATNTGTYPQAGDIALIGGSNTITITAGIFMAAGSVTISDDASVCSLSINGTGSLTLSGNLTVNTGGSLASSGTMIFNGASTQTISGSGTFSFANITMSTSGLTNIAVNSSIPVSGTISWTADGLIVVGSSANITLGTGATITSPTTARYVQLDGSTGTNSNLIFTAPFPLTYPIGTSSGGYTPVTFGSITTAPAGGSTLSVKAIYNLSNQGQLRRTLRFIVAGNANGTFFNTGTFKYNNTTDISSGDAESNYTTEWYLAASTTTAAWTNIATIAAPTNQFVVTGGSTATASLGTGTYYYTIGQSSAYPNTWYSYQTGVWSNWQNWTSDPSGSSLVNGLNLPPQPGDGIVILNGITITNDVSGQVATTAIINSGATLDMSTTNGNTLGTVSGSGLLRIKGIALPTGTYTAFVTASTGGTIEYYDASGTLPTSQTTYNNLKLTNSTASAITFIETNDLTINNNFNITASSTGTVTWQINDNSNANRTITIAGDLTVSSNGKITAGTGNAGSATQHSLTLSGTLTNNGIIQFFDPTDAGIFSVTAGFPSTTVYTLALQGNAVNVTFGGTTSKTLTCNNQTDFYRLILNKGTGQQAMLTVNSSSTANFRIFGPNNIARSGAAPNYVSNNDLAIINGTLQLTGSINIPNMIVDNGGTSSWPIPQNGALWINSSTVTVQMADNTVGDNKHFHVFGLLRVTNGTVNLGYSRGLLGGGSGYLLMEGGTINTWQLRTTNLGTGNNFAYVQSGGTINVGTTGLSGVDITDFPRFCLMYTTCTFQMSGGALNVGNPMNGGIGNLGGIMINTATSNTLVTGGTVSAFIPASAVNFTITSTASFYNLNINKDGAGAAVAILNGISAFDGVSTIAETVQPLVVLNNLTLVTANSPTLNCNAINLTVGGNLTGQASTTLTPGGNIITFNGSGAQTWTNSGTITSLTTVVVNKSAGTLTCAGSTLPNIGTLTLTSGTFADGGNVVTVSGTLTNNATHVSSSATGVISYFGTNPIGGTNGTFGNLTILTSNAIVATSGNQTVTGNLKLNGTTKSILNIGSNSLTVNGTITSGSVGLGHSSYIQTSGFHNAGGLTRPATAATDIVFPVGVSTFYSPNTINVNSATTFGMITVRPVNSEHPNVTATNVSLAFYWRVTSSGFVGLGSTITHKAYTFNDGTSQATRNGTLTTYIAARYDRSANTWGQSSVAGQTMATKILPDPINTGTSWTGVAGDQLDGEYTCGNSGAFGVFLTYYSRASGAWNDVTTVWSTTSNTGGACACSPTACANCPVIIGDGTNNHSITIDANSRSCGTLTLSTGSTLDCQTYTSLNFGTSTGGAVTGTGTLRIGSANFPAGDFTNFLGSSGGTVEWYALAGGLSGAIPANSSALLGMTAATYTNIAASSVTGSGSGARFTVVVGSATSITSVTASATGGGYAANDILTFNGSLFGGSGSATYKIAAGNIVAAYTVPTTGSAPQSLSLANYYNLVLNPAAATTITLPASNLTIYNNLTQGAGTGTVTNNGVRTIAITGNLTISAGTLSLTSSGNTTLTVGGNVSNSGTFSTTGGTHTLTVTGGITNNNAINFNNTGTVALTLTGSSTVSFTGTGAGGTTLSTVTVNKGSSQVPTVNFIVGGTVTAATSGWLTLTNGSFIFNNGGAYTISSASASYTIPSSANLTVQSGTVTLLNANNTTADLLLNGSIGVSGTGTLNIGASTGPGVFTNAIDNDIEYASAGTPTISISGGGTLNVGGSIRRSTGALSGALVYNQTGGAVYVGGNASDNTRGVFEVDANTGSSFTLTGTGALTVQRQTNGTGYADVYINPITSSVSSTSTISVGLTTATTQANLRINIAPAIGNFTVLGPGAAANPQTVNLYSNPMVLGGTLSITTPSVLVTNSFNVSIAGNLTVTGSGTATYTGGTNTTTFNGTGAQSANLTSTSTFTNITVNNSGGGTVTLSGTAPTLSNLNILSGILDVGSLALNVNGNITNNSSQVASGAGSITFTTTTTASHTITSSNGSFTNLKIGGATAATNNLVTVSGNMSMNGYLDFVSTTASRYLFIGSNLLTFGTTATIANAGASTFIKTNGVSSDLGVTKNWPVGTNSFTYSVGTRTNYTPVTFTNLVVATAGNYNIIPVDAAHPTSSPTGPQILDYYWKVIKNNTLVHGATGTLVFQAPTGLIGGSGGTLIGAYLDAINLIGWTSGGVISTVATNTLLTFTNSFTGASPTAVLPSSNGEFDYTFGTTTTLPNPITPVYSRFADADHVSNATTVGTLATGGSWAIATSWTLATDGYGAALSSVPTGRPVVILPAARINLDILGQSAFTTTISGLLVVTTTGHNIGSIINVTTPVAYNTTGTMRTTTNTLPAGTYTTFTASGGGTIEYVAPMTMNGRSTYNNLSIYSGSAGTVTMTATDLAINGNVTIPASTILDNSVNNKNMTVGGNWTGNGSFTAGTGTVTFNGTGAQSVTGTTTFNNFTISKTGNATLNAINNVGGVLTLTSGNIISNAYSAVTSPFLVLTSAATVSGGSSSSFVSGQIRKTISSGGSFAFPVGSNAVSRYRPATISSTTATDVWDVTYFGNNPTTDGYSASNFNSSNIAKVSHFEYWQVARSGSTSASLTLTYDVGSYAGDIGDVTQLKTARWNGAQWDIPPGGGTFSYTGNSTTGSVTVSIQSSFSPTTIATTDGSSGLPITLLSFTGETKKSAVELKWATSAEINNNYFTVLHSSTGSEYKPVGTVKGNGTTNVPHDYTLLDKNPVIGRNYYQLMQTDFDGQFTKSEAIAVNVISLDPLVLIYPNPVSRNLQQDLNVEINGLTSDTPTEIQVLNLQGSTVQRAIVKTDGDGSLKATLSPTHLNPGLYILSVQGVHFKFVVE